MGTCLRLTSTATLLIGLQLSNLGLVSAATKSNGDQTAPFSQSSVVAHSLLEPTPILQNQGGSKPAKPPQPYVPPDNGQGQGGASNGSRFWETIDPEII
ncbi:MAG: hypothetical protein ACOC0N_01150 [Chroococcales cyanobacterium]